MIFNTLNIMIIVVALFYLIIGSIEDLKTREVMDYSNYSLLALGITINILYAIIFNQWIIALQSIAGYLAFVGIAYIMYYAGQWGGGDSKMLMGLGALIGLQFTFSGLPFLADFFINTLLFGAVYGILWSIGLSIKHGKKVSKGLGERLHSRRKLRNYLLFFSGTLIIIAVVLNSYLVWTATLSLVFISFFSYYLWNFIKSIEHVIMYKEISINKLTEGDWIVNDVVVKGKYICGPKDLGISKEAINRLKELKINKILVKEGIPFVPSFLIAFIFTIVARNFWLAFIR